jgi:hypothetical protein
MQAPINNNLLEEYTITIMMLDHPTPLPNIKEPMCTHYTNGQIISIEW